MKIPDIIKETASNLRNNMTISEVILWNYLKNSSLWVKFLRQKPVYVYTENSWLDRYIIPDFYCHERKVVIEVDWSIHNLKEIYNLDLHKEELLKNLWFKIIRITNTEIDTDIKNVLLKIKNNL